MQQKVLVEAQMTPAAAAADEEERGSVSSMDLGGGPGFAVERCSGEAQRTCSYVHGLTLYALFYSKKKFRDK